MFPSALTSRTVFSSLAARLSPLTPSSGYSLLELLIAMAAGTVMLLAAIQSFQQFQQRFTTQRTDIAEHQDLRTGLAVMGSELRLAGVGGRLFGLPCARQGRRRSSFSQTWEGGRRVWRQMSRRAMKA